MQSNEFYYLVMVCGTFAVFAASLAVSYIQYRRWLKQPTSRYSMTTSTSSLNMSPSNSLAGHALVAGRKPQKPGT
ncbi:MAG: hypothetical protein ACXWLB_21505 [Reyranella sp.]